MLIFLNLIVISPPGHATTRMQNSTSSSSPSVCRHKKSGWQYSWTFLLDFWQFFANEKSYQRSASVKRNRFFGMVYFIFLNQFLCTISLIDYFNLVCTNSIKSNSNCFSCGKLYAGLKKYNNAVGGIADKYELCGSGL